jgi:hypothetical protein
MSEPDDPVVGAWNNFGFTGMSRHLGAIQK